MTIRRRVERLEDRTPAPAPAPVRSGSVTLGQIRALEEHIRRLEAGDEVGTAPDYFLEEPDNEVAAIERDILRLEEMEDRRDNQDPGDPYPTFGNIR